MPVASNQPNLGISGATSPNYNVVGNYNHFATGPNTTNNANFQHKQRQLSYSPNMAAAKLGNPGGPSGQKGKKRNISETGHPITGAPGAQSVAQNMLGQGIDPFHMNQVPSRRSQSKNDKYKDAGDIGGGFGSLNNFGQPGNQKHV